MGLSDSDFVNLPNEFYLMLYAPPTAMPLTHVQIMGTCIRNWHNSNILTAC